MDKDTEKRWILLCDLLVYIISNSSVYSEDIGDKLQLLVDECTKNKEKT